MPNGVPESIAGYRIDGVLGRGADGVVYRAFDERLGRPAALKVVSDGLDEEARARFMIEARAAGQLLHPNIVQVFSVGEHEGRTFLVEELVDGCPLSDLLAARGRLSPAAVIDVAAQVASGLHAAEVAEVLHRDVKPQNLLLDAEGHVKIADFGIAKLLRSPSGITGTGTTLGTPHYMSPEQGRGRTLDARSDQYALGATLYHLIAGHPPFDADEPLAVLLKHAEEPLVPLIDVAPDCPIELAAAVEKMLSKSADDRFDSFAEVIDVFESFETDDDAELSPPERIVTPLPVQATPVATGRHVSVAERFVAVAAVAAALSIGAIMVMPNEGRSRRQSAAMGAAPFSVLAPASPPVVTLPRSQQKWHDSKKRRAFEAEVRQATAKRDANRLIELLRSEHEVVAIGAARALADLRDIRAIEPLTAASVSNSSDAVRHAASDALRRIYHVEGE